MEYIGLELGLQRARVPLQPAHQVVRLRPVRAHQQPVRVVQPQHQQPVHQAVRQLRRVLVRRQHFNLWQQHTLLILKADS
jgi:hypothetical protein